MSGLSGGTRSVASERSPRPRRSVALPIWAGLVALIATRATWAAYEPFPMPDPSRRWAVNATVRGEYDDNIFTTATSPQDSFKAIIEPQVLLNIPLEQTFFGLRYNYGGTWYTDRPGDDYDQSHSADLLFSHTFTPRLTLDLRDNMRFGQEPELVEQSAGTPVVVRRRGDYLYNNLNGKLSYNLSRRWTAAVSGGWERWRYDDAAVATANDRDDYQATLSALYAIDPRTVVGGNYRFGVTDYVNPAPLPAAPDSRDATSHILYVSGVRRFNPQFSAQVSAGAELRLYEDGQDDLGPYVDGAVQYTYAPESLVRGGIRYVFTDTEQSTFRSAESAVLFAHIAHRITGKFHAGGDVLLAFNTFTESLVGGPDADETVLQLAVRLTYKFTRWCNGEFHYTFDDVSSDLPNSDFDRNRVSLGVRLVY